MKIFRKRGERAAPELIPAERSILMPDKLPAAVDPCEKELFDRLRGAAKEHREAYADGKNGFHVNQCTEKMPGWQVKLR